MAQRSRKRGRRGKPTARASAPATPTVAARSPAKVTAPPPAKPPRTQWFAPSVEEVSRSQRRDAEARANLEPLAPGERPMAIRVSAVLAGLLGLANLVAWLAGDKIGGKHPAAGGILLFSGVMLVCALGLWRMWYGAVLGFMALLAIIGTLFSLYLVEASNALGFIVAPIIIAGAGYLFFKLVRVLSRIQMPQRPGG
ncbi:MAG TPA: hypothetical protein VGH67_14570 [Solirubrobacteraceae bacterium]